MPAVEANQSKRVLVTGANGYIALWVIKTLLEQGYKVRGAVRSEGKGKRLLETFKSYSSENLEFVVVEDITAEGAFDEAVKEVDAIEHTASPLTASSEDPEELIQPAVRGTLGVLNSALKNGPNIKRIVITSSCAAVAREDTTPNVTLDENNWADQSIQLVKEQGGKAPFMSKYRASKALAERGAWEYREKHKAEIGWDLVTILPPVVIGPPLHEVNGPADLNASLGIFYNGICNERPEDALKSSYGYVHVRDIANAHVESLKKEAAGGNRFIISSGSTTWQHTRNMVRDLYPELYESGTLPVGVPDLPNVILWNFNSEKSKKILGIKYKTLEDVSRDILEYFKSRGWLEEGKFNTS